ncbi:MAG: hypothetical protein AB7E48_00890 [Deferribacterales bacterium]
MKVFRHAVISPALPEEYLDMKTLGLLSASNFKGEKQEDGRVLFSSEDPCGVDELCSRLAAVIEHRLQENRADYPVSVALKISLADAETGICGGEAYFITAFHVEHFSTEQWLEEKIQEHASAAEIEFFD